MGGRGVVLRQPTRYDLVVSLQYLPDSVTGRRWMWEWLGDGRCALLGGGGAAAAAAAGGGAAAGTM